MPAVPELPASTEPPATGLAGPVRGEHRPPTWRDEARVLLRLLAWTVLAAVAVGVVLAGVAAREEMWRSTESVRYQADMRNAWYWGSRAAQEGYAGLYDQVIAEHPDRQYGLDYVPLRLAAMTWWALHERSLGVIEWENSRSMNAPLLALNYLSDIASGLGVFAIVFTLVRRAGRTYLVCGTLAVTAGAMLWLNPAVTVSGFGRPTWDVWVLPFFLWACLAGTYRQWALAGVLIGVGAMCKGQVLATAPFMAVWFAWAGGWRRGEGLRAVMGFAGGIVVAMGVVASPWILTRGGEWDWGWAGRVVAAAAAPLGARYLLREVAWNRYLPGWRWTGTFSLVLAAGVLCLSATQSGASMGWWEVGFRYGADKFPQLEVGGSSSLAGILAQRYGWRSGSIPFRKTLPGVTMKELLLGLYGVCAVLAGIAAGRAQRSRDPRRLLVAIPAVWIAYFAFMPLMHERYLLWGAACAALCVGVSPGLTVLGVLLSIESWVMTLRVMLIANKDGAGYELLGYGGETWKRWFDVAFPGAGWGVIFAAVVFLYLAFAGGTRKAEERPL